MHSAELSMFGIILGLFQNRRDVNVFNGIKDFGSSLNCVQGFGNDFIKLYVSVGARCLAIRACNKFRDEPRFYCRADDIQPSPYPEDGAGDARPTRATLRPFEQSR